MPAGAATFLHTGPSQAYAGGPREAGMHRVVPSRQRGDCHWRIKRKSHCTLAAETDGPPLLRSSPSDASWGPNGVGSQALGVFWGELSPTWGKVLHVLLQRHLLPRLILVLPGPGKEAGGGGLAQMAQMGLGVEAAPPGPAGAVGQDLDG